MTIQPLLGPKGRIPILIRDDDTNFFTKTEMLESIYSKAWNEGFKVSLSVIPLQKGIDDISVPPNERKTGLSYSIVVNESLIKYLKNKIQQESVEILQHGIHHTYDECRRGEFAGTSYNGKQILCGRDIIVQAFGTEPKFFVPPGEDISQKNLKLISQLGMIPIYRNTIFDRFLRFQHIPNIIKKVPFRLIMRKYSKISPKDCNMSLMKPVIINPMNGFITWSLPSSKFLNLSSPEALLDLTRIIINSCSMVRTPVCILNHYHPYFYDWSSTITRNELFKTWNEVLRSFNELEFGWKVDFKRLYERFRKIQKVHTLKTGSKITIEAEEEITDYSFLGSSSIEQNSSAIFDKETKICTIKHILPQSQIVLYEKG